MCTICAICPRPAAASEPEIVGPGTRSPAMGGTGVSFADDFEASYANPAGLAFAKGRRLAAGFVLGRYSLRLDGKDRPVDETNGLFIGAHLPLPLGGVLKDRLVLGLLIYLPLGVVNRAENPFPDEPFLALLENRTQTVSIMLTAGVRILHNLSIGGGALALAALTGTIDIDTDAAGRFTSVSNQQLVASYAPIVGARFDPVPRVRIGLAFRGESLSRYDIAVRSDLSAVLKLFSLPTLRIAGVSQYDPMQLAAEVSFAPSESWLLAAGIAWARWSAYPQPAEWATPPPEGTPLPPAPDFHDTVVPRAGLEWNRAVGPTRTSLRLGYAFVQTPAPEGPAPEGGNARPLVDAHRHVFTGGAEVYFENRVAPIRLSGFFQWHQLHENARAGGSFAVLGVGFGSDL